MMSGPKFKFKIDPRDISSIYLCDEGKNEYIEIQNADPEFGHISLEEYIYLRKVLKRNGFNLDTATVMSARENLSDLIIGSRKEKAALVKRQKKAGMRARDLAGEPTVSSRAAERESNDNDKWVQEPFEVEVPDNPTRNADNHSRPRKGEG